MSWARRWAFARHIPPRRIAARLWLEGKRRINQRTRPALTPPPDLRVADTPPLAIFAPREGLVEPVATGWRFTFLNRAIEMGESIDWSAPGPGTEHQLWRMNLHYMEYLETLGPDDGLTLIERWIAANPPYAPGAWRDAWNSYALSLRVVVWMQWLANHGLRPAAVIDSLARQILFLERNLEIDIGGNHLVKNIKALLWASTFFEGAAADRWRCKGLELLRRELTRQILPDGMHYERSPSYHAQVFADVIEIRHAIGDDALLVTLAAMARATALLAHPDGGPAQLSDAGLTMAYSPAECLAIYARVTIQSVEVPQGAFALPDAGYFGFHSPTLSLVADIGRIGPDDLPAHAHGDIGSFELSVGRVRMIVDQGVYEYVAGSRRRASRAAAGHNTLAVEGSDQADFFGAFRCGRRPDVTLEAYEPSADGFVLQGRHNGYAHLPGKPIATRRFEVSGPTISIFDRLSAPVPASVGLLLHPECAATIDGTTATITRGTSTLVIAASHPLAIAPAVWWPDMGHELATSRLTLTYPPGCLESALVLSVAAGGTTETA